MWDPGKLTFADPSCDAAWLTCNYRDPWKVWRRILLDNITGKITSKPMLH